MMLGSIHTAAASLVPPNVGTGSELGKGGDVVAHSRAACVDLLHHCRREVRLDGSVHRRAHDLPPRPRNMICTASGSNQKLSSCRGLFTNSGIVGLRIQMESWNFSCVHQHSDERRLVTEYCLLLAASRPGCRQNLVLPLKSCVCLTRSSQFPAVQKTLVSGFVKNLLQNRHENCRNGSHPFHPCSSVANRVGTNGDSFTFASFRPESMRIHSSIDSSKIIATITIKIPVTNASSRSLKISRAFPPVAANCRACDKKPILGLASNILCNDAVNVTETNQTSGSSVTLA